MVPGTAVRPAGCARPGRRPRTPRSDPSASGNDVTHGRHLLTPADGTGALDGRRRGASGSGMARHPSTDKVASTLVQLSFSRCPRYPAIGHGDADLHRRRVGPARLRRRPQRDRHDHADGARGRRRLVLVAAEVTDARAVHRAESPERGPCRQPASAPRAGRRTRRIADTRPAARRPWWTKVHWAVARADGKIP